MSNKIHTFLFMAAALLLGSSCERGDTPDAPLPIEEEALVVGVGGYGVSVKSPGVANDCQQFKDDNVALYAVSYNLGKNPEWPANKTGYLIRNTAATVVTDKPAQGQENRIGEIIYYSGKPTIFPETRVALYAIYPTTPNAGLELVEVDGKAPVANVTLKTDIGKQYDVMTAVLPDLSRDSIASKHRATLTFEHTLAMLKLKIYADPAVVGNRKLTDVTVNANSQAKLADISSKTYTDHSTPTEMKLYNNTTTGIVVPTGADATAATLIEGQVMIFPEPSKVNSVTITVDEKIYTVKIPETYVLKVGQTNTITIRLAPMGVQLGDMSIGKWETTADVSENTEVVQFKTNFKVKLYQGLKAVPTPYNATGTFTASVKINGVYWLEGSDKTREIPCTLAADGTLSFKESIPTCMLNDDPVYLTDLVVFKDGVEVLNQKVSTATPKLEIEKGDDKGTLKVVGRNADASFNVDYVGFGAGTAAFPYEVETPQQLAKLPSFVSATPTIGVHFVQIADLDLGPYLKRNGSGVAATPIATVIGDANGWTPIGNATTKFYGTYDGKDKAIKNLNINRTATYQGLFGYAGKPTDGNSEFKNINISGYVKGTQSVGLVAGAVEGAATISNCVANVTLIATGTWAGGIVGYLKGAITLSDCKTNGSVIGTGPVGGIIGFVTGGTTYTISNSINNATVTASASGVGGCLGQTDASPTTITNVQNSGAVTSTSTKVGGIVGAVSGSMPINIINSGNTAQIKTTITSASSYVGGIIGYPNTGISGDKIEECYNTGNVTSLGGFVGGVVGYVKTNPFTLTDCYNTGTITGTSNVGGLLADSKSVTLIKYSYNAGIVVGLSVVDPIAPGAGAITNVYYHSALTGIISGLTGVVQLDMTSPEALTNLNGGRTAVWSADKATPVNSGMPILLWQTK